MPMRNLQVNRFLADLLAMLLVQTGVCTDKTRLSLEPSIKLVEELHVVGSVQLQLALRGGDGHQTLSSIVSLGMHYA